MNNDTALILMLADRQRDIEALRAEVAALRAENDGLRAEVASRVTDHERGHEADLGA